MAQVSGAVKLTEKQPGTATTESYVLVTQKELPSDYIITGDEEEGELDAMKVESVRRIPAQEIVGLVQSNMEYDEAPTAESEKALKSGAVKTALDGKEDKLTFDSEPTAESLHPVTSAGIHAAIGELKENITQAENALAISKNISGSHVELSNKPISATIKTNIADGKTSLQLVVGGKNLLVYPYFRGDSYTHNGITYTVNVDGSITANGTATADSQYNINYYPIPNWIHDGWIYISGCAGGSDTTFYIVNTTSGHKQYDSVLRINIINGFTLNLAIVIKSGTTVTNQLFKPMIALSADAEYDRPATLYTATVDRGTTEYTWTGIAFRNGYNLITPQYGDTINAIVSVLYAMSEVYDVISQYVNHWKDKKWVAFGTSITDNWSANSYITQGEHTGEHTGKYVPYLLDMSELSSTSFVNRGISGGSINGHILYYIRYYTSDQADADLITIEGAVNDFATSVPLGQVGDTVPYTNSLLSDSTSEGSFAGACYQAFTAALTNAPNAVVVLLTETTGKDHVGYANYNQLRKNDLGLYQSDYIEMTMKVAEFVGIPVINCGRDSMINAENPQYIADHIHHTYLGGYQYARTIWAKLKGIPLKALTEPVT